MERFIINAKHHTIRFFDQPGIFAKDLKESEKVASNAENKIKKILHEYNAEDSSGITWEDLIPEKHWAYDQLINTILRFDTGAAVDDCVGDRWCSGV